MKIIKIERNDQHRIADIQKIIRFTHNRYPKIIIDEDVIHSLYRHAECEMHHEVGGYLLGIPLIDKNTNNKATFIKFMHIAEYVSTPSHVTMNPKSLMHVDHLCKKTSSLLVGYYHSHPNLSVFQSGEDVENFKMYYPEIYQVAIVIDPSMTTPYTYKFESDWIGFFMWNQENHNPMRVPRQNIVICSKWEPKFLEGESHPRNFLVSDNFTKENRFIYPQKSFRSIPQEVSLFNPAKHFEKSKRKWRLKNNKMFLKRRRDNLLWKLDIKDKIK